MPDDRKGGFGFVHVDGTLPISEFFEEDKADYNVNAAIIVTGKLDELPVQGQIASKVYSFRKFIYI